MFGWFVCCTAAAADRFDSPSSKDARQVRLPPAVKQHQQRLGQHKPGRDQHSHHQAEPLEPGAKQADAATAQKPGRVSLRKKCTQHCSDPEDAVASGTAAAANAPIMARSIPLTSRSLIAAATGCHSLSASANVQAYQRAGGAFRHQDTGDSPSEIHSELVVQQTKKLSSCSTNFERSGDQTAGSVHSITSADASPQNQQQQHLQQQHGQEQQCAVPSGQVIAAAQTSLCSMLLLESQHQQQQQHFPSSNSCHATASSAGTAVLQLEGIAPMQATATATAAASNVKPMLQHTWNDAGTVAQESAGEDIGGTQQKQQDSISRTNTILSASGDSSTLPPHVHLYRLESGASFKMADPQLSSSSSGGILRTTSSMLGASASTPGALASSRGDSFIGTLSITPSSDADQAAQPSSAKADPMLATTGPTVAAAAAAAVSPGSYVHFTCASKSPFASLTMQQRVTSALLSHQQQQIQQRYSVPLVQQTSSAHSFLSAPSAAAAAAAAAGRASNSGIHLPTAAAAPLMPLTLNAAAARSTHISWAAACTTPAPESAVFGVLDPDTASADSDLRILRHSASSNNLRHSASGTSLSSMTAGLAAGLSSSFSGKSAKGKLQQLRQAVSMSWDQAGDTNAAAAAAGAGARTGLRSILRRSTEALAPATLQSSASAFRRSKSAHSNITQQQTVIVTSAADAETACDQAVIPAAGFLAATSSSSTDLRHNLPPLPPAAPGSAALSGPGSSAVTLEKTYTAAAVARSTSSSFATSSSLAIVPAAAAADGLIPPSSNRLLYNVQAPQTLDWQSSTSSGIATAGTLMQSGGSSGSLVVLAVTRMHSAANLGNKSSGSSTSSAAGSATGGMNPHSQGSRNALSTVSSSSGSAGSLAAQQGSTGSTMTKAGVHNSSSVQVATAFADAFLAALAAGNTKWGSDMAVAQLFHDTAKMLGMDKQLYVGKAAIVRRLNTGMDQLVKMVAANAPDNSTPAGSTTAVADLAGSMPKPDVTILCPDPKAKPSVAVATYTFKWGIRKFTLRDEFIVKQGQIMRLRRSRG